MENIIQLFEGTEVTPDTALVSNPHLHVIHTSNDEVLVKHSGRSPYSRVVRDDGQTKLIGKLLRQLKQPRSIRDLVNSGDLHGDEVEDCLQLARYLVEESVLVDPQRDPTQLYLDTLIGRETELASQHVALIGSGYLGRRLAQQLVDLGIGRLTLVDERRVANPRIERRFFSLPESQLEVGRPFTDCVRSALAEHGFDAVETIEAPHADKGVLRKAFSSADFVVVAAESMRTGDFHAVNEVAIELRKPWLLVHMDGSEAYVGPLFVPGQGPCYSEFEVQHEASSLGVKDEYLTYKEALNRLDMERTPLVLPSYMDTAAGMAVVGLLHFLAGARSFLVGRCVRYDFERLSVDYEEVLRLPRCPACAPFRPYRHPYL